MTYRQQSSYTSIPAYSHLHVANMVLASLRRHLSRVFAPRSTDSVNSFDATNPKDTAQVDERLQGRSSPKASIYQRSPPQSGVTLHNPEHVPTNLSSDVLVQVMTVGDSVITIETQREDEHIERPAAKRRKGLGLRRVKTAPPVSQTVPVHGSITTIESAPNGSRRRAWSYPLGNWRKFSLVRRMRRGSDLKEVRKKARGGKAACELDSERQPPAAQNTAHPFMSGAYQGSPSHMNSATDEMGISPRTSIDLGSGHAAFTRLKGSPTKPSTIPNSPNEDQNKRKDSHFHGVMQVKEQASAEVEANTKEPTSEEQSSKSTAFLLHAIDWIRQRRASVSSNSSSSDSPVSCPYIQPARPPRRTQEVHTTQTQPAVGRLSMVSSCDESSMKSRLNLPPGFEIPVEGQAGPVDWLHRGWEEHYRRSAESAHRACHPLAAARCFPSRGEEYQRYHVVTTSQDGPQCIHAQRTKSIPDHTEYVTQVWDFANDRKGKGRKYVENADVEEGRGRLESRDVVGAEQQRERRRSSKGVCVTTVTLGECNFAKELDQSVA